MSDFLDSNPWWRRGGDMGESFKEYTRAKVKWDPRIRHRFSNEDVVYTLRGPRQVGKTTLIKLNIRDLLDKGVPARNIFYYDCEGVVANPAELMRIISAFLDAPGVVKGSRRYIFLDEISSVRNWQAGIKRLHDGGRLKKCTLVLAGSHALDVAKATERLPGRRGESKDVPDKVMVPMKFAEYVETLDEELRRLFDFSLRMGEVRRKVLLNLSRGKEPSEIKELRYHENKIRRLFESYLVTGGVPKVVNDYRESGEIPESTYKRYVDVVRGDLSRWNRREGYIRRILSRIIETMGSPVSWRTLAEGTDIGSHNTVPEYVDTLRDTFMLCYLFRLDTTRNESAFEKDKKLYFSDPFFLHAMNGWVNGGDPYEETVRFLENTEKKSLAVEGVVADHLVRLSFQLSKQKQLFDYEKVLHYWRSNNQHELDFVVNLERGYLPIESKYQNKIRKDDRYGLADFARVTGTKREIIISKNEFETYRGGAIVPAWLFLLLV